jgi:hypothetical protein
VLRDRYLEGLTLENISEAISNSNEISQDAYQLDVNRIIDNGFAMKVHNTANLTIDKKVSDNVLKALKHASSPRKNVESFFDSSVYFHTGSNKNNSKNMLMIYDKCKEIEPKYFHLIKGLAEKNKTILRSEFKLDNKVNLMSRYSPLNLTNSVNDVLKEKNSKLILLNEISEIRKPTEKIYFDSGLFDKIIEQPKLLDHFQRAEGLKNVYEKLCGRDEHRFKELFKARYKTNYTKYLKEAYRIINDDNVRFNPVSIDADIDLYKSVMKELLSA